MKTLGRLAMLAIIPAFMAMAACGTGSPAATPTQDLQEQARKYSQCMRENGVELPDQSSDSGGGSVSKVEPGTQMPDPKKMQDASEKCRQLLPNAGDPEPMSAQNLEELKAYAKCMRENGLPNFPDPDPNTGALGAGGTVSGNGAPGPGGEIKLEDLQKADEKCSNTMPSPAVKK